MGEYRISASFLNALPEEKQWRGVLMEALMKKWTENKWSAWGCYFEDFLDAYYHSDRTKFELPEFFHENGEIENYVNQQASLLTKEQFDRLCAEISPSGEMDTEWQEWIIREIWVDGDRFMIVGKPDIYSRTQNNSKGRIIDLKTSAKIPSKTKYDYSIQHPMYMWFLGIEDFDYLARSGETPNLIHKRSYSMPVDVAKEKVEQSIRNMMNHLKANPPLMKLFEANFKYTEGMKMTH